LPIFQTVSEGVFSEVRIEHLATLCSRAAVKPLNHGPMHRTHVHI
jgi:hypothetical protein